MCIRDSIAAGMEVEIDQLPRVVKALRPWATLTESLKGSGAPAVGKRDVFSELKGISVRRIGTGSPRGTPPASPIIKSPTHPDSMDTVFAFAESVRRKVEDQHAMGKIMGPDALAIWLKNDVGLSRYRGRMFD
jgi:hypothetical protein